jgi:hypothetical protein
MNSRDMSRMSHRPYSPDVAPSDFYLFGTAKSRLEQVRLTEPDELSKGLHSILSSILGGELEAVFQTWLERIRAVPRGGWELRWLINISFCDFVS